MKRNSCFIYPKTFVNLWKVYDIMMLVKKSYRVLRPYSKLLSLRRKNKALANWAARIGESAAEKIKDESAARGTAMHKILEKYILEQGYLDLTNVGKQAHNMAHASNTKRSYVMFQNITAQNARYTTQVYTQDKQI